MPALEIVTPRLRLVACDAGLLEAAMAGSERLCELTGAAPHPQWPGDDFAGVMPVMLTAATRDPEATKGWLAWLIVENGTIVGDAGAHGPPAGGHVEIGFSVVPERQGRGIATEAVAALCTRFAREVSAIVARVEQGNPASAAVLRRAGFELASTEGTIDRYERTT